MFYFKLICVYIVTQRFNAFLINKTNVKKKIVFIGLKVDFDR